MVNDDQFNPDCSGGSGDVYGHAQGHVPTFLDSGSHSFTKRPLKSKRILKTQAVQIGQPFLLKNILQRSKL